VRLVLLCSCSSSPAAPAAPPRRSLVSRMSKLARSRNNSLCVVINNVMHIDTRITSSVVEAFSWIAVVLTAIATAFWISIVLQEDGWAALGFIVIAPRFGGGLLLLGVIPSGILYVESRQRDDLKNLWRSAGALLAIGAEAGLLFILPLKAC